MSVCCSVSIIWNKKLQNLLTSHFSFESYISTQKFARRVVDLPFLLASKFIVFHAIICLKRYDKLVKCFFLLLSKRKSFLMLCGETIDMKKSRNTKNLFDCFVFRAWFVHSFFTRNFFVLSDGFFVSVIFLRILIDAFQGEE